MSSRYGSKRKTPAHPLVIDHVQAYGIMMWAARVGDPEAHSADEKKRLRAWEEKRVISPIWENWTKDVEWTLERVPIKKLKINRKLLISQDKVNLYAQQPDSGAPPILVGPNNYPLDGQHRLLAARKRGDKFIMAYMPRPK